MLSGVCCGSEAESEAQADDIMGVVLGEAVMSFSGM